MKSCKLKKLDNNRDIEQNKKKEIEIFRARQSIGELQAKKKKDRKKVRYKERDKQQKGRHRFR